MKRICIFPLKTKQILFKSRHFIISNALQKKDASMEYLSLPSVSDLQM